MNKMKKINYSLPEFVHLDGIDHNGDSLKGRTVIQHIRSYTVLEVVALDEVAMCDFGKNKKHIFTYTNAYGVREEFMFVLHFTFSEEDELPEIFRKCEKWYKKVLAWEDKGIHAGEVAKLN
jgi:hypothetical protein